MVLFILNQLSSPGGDYFSKVAQDIYFVQTLGQLLCLSMILAQTVLKSTSSTEQISGGNIRWQSTFYLTIKISICQCLMSQCQNKFT